MSRWISAKPEDRFEPCPAVYAIYSNDALVYIGETSNLQKRIHQHNFVLAHYSCTYKTDQFGWIGDITIKFSYSKRFGDWRMREMRLIRRLKPSFNFRGLNRWKQKEVARG